MPVHEDFIARMVRQLAAALARVAGLRRAARVEEAEEELASAFSTIAGIDARLVQHSPAELLAAQLGDAERIRVVARLCAARAELLAAAAGSGDPEALAWREKAEVLQREAAARSR